MKHKGIIKGLTILPFGGSFSFPVLPLESDTHVHSRSRPKENFVRETGIPTFINATGTYTIMTASLTDDEVLNAIDHLDKKRSWSGINLISWKRTIKK